MANRRAWIGGLGAAWLVIAAGSVLAKEPEEPRQWKRLDTVPYRGKQDDVFFVDADRGWYVNGAGFVYGTGDGGETWTELTKKPGTYFRCIGFLDVSHGFAGNIGTEYFPNVTDETPLYETVDGGKTWRAAKILPGPVPKGLCAVDVVRRAVVDAGRRAEQITLYAGGRVGGPAFLLRSTDRGASWTSRDLSATCGMVLDVKFFDAEHGLLCAATSGELAESHALILWTSDGGKTWERRYESKRPYELTWKCSFPTRKTGYVTVQSYDPDPEAKRRVVVKTTDGGATWKEIALVDDAACREFGVGFLDENTGWVGTLDGGYETTDGGATWTRADLGPAVNKIRFVTGKGGSVGYAIGAELRKLRVDEAPPSAK